MALEVNRAYSHGVEWEHLGERESYFCTVWLSRAEITVITGWKYLWEWGISVQEVLKGIEEGKTWAGHWGKGSGLRLG